MQLFKQSEQGKQMSSDPFAEESAAGSKKAGKSFFRNRKLRSFQTISFSFLAVILSGSFLLMLPWATQSGRATPFIEALFTSTSATCVTGLVVQNTATYWSTFGKAVILLLIQIGGLGLVTLGAGLSVLLGRRIGLAQRSVMQTALSAPQLGGIVRFMRFVLLLTAAIEGLGAIALSFYFVPEFGLVRGIGYGFFHSISAFCNAGFDLLGQKTPFVSLVGRAGHPLLILTVSLLILAGGLGFLTWNDILSKRFKWERYRLQSKLVLIMTLLLVVLPALFFFFHENRTGGALADLSTHGKIWGAYFQAVTPRTAGFNSIPLDKLTEPGQAVIILLMLLGGASGSTAGGMKISTFVIVTLTALAVFRQRRNTLILHRRISSSTIRQALAVFTAHLSFFALGGFLISIFDRLPLMATWFESASAISTVGLTLGITPKLSHASHLVLIFLMYWGRVGGLTLIFATLSKQTPDVINYPEEDLSIG